MSKKQLKLLVVSQEKQLLEEEVGQVTAPATTGQITILPDHIPLLTELETGILEYQSEGTVGRLVVSQGFLDKGPDNTLTIIVDMATHERDISLEKAQQAIKRAQETIASNPTDVRELLLAEASLRQAMWEAQLAEKTKKSKI